MLINARKVLFHRNLKKGSAEIKINQLRVEHNYLADFVSRSTTSFPVLGPEL